MQRACGRCIDVTQGPALVFHPFSARVDRLQEYHHWTNGILIFNVASYLEIQQIFIRAVHASNGRAIYRLSMDSH